MDFRVRILLNLRQDIKRAVGGQTDRLLAKWTFSSTSTSQIIGNCISAEGIKLPDFDMDCPGINFVDNRKIDFDKARNVTLAALGSIPVEKLSGILYVGDRIN